MSQVLILLRKSLLNLSRARSAIAITFVVPIVLIYLFGHVFGLYHTDSGPSGIPIAVVNLSPEPVAAQLVAAMKAEKAFAVMTETKARDGSVRPLTEADVRAALRDNDYRYALILPADLLSDERMGLRLKFLSNPRNEIEAQTVNGVLQKTVFSKVPHLLGQSLQRQAKRYLGDARYQSFNRGLATNIAGAFGGDPAEVQKQIEAGEFGLQSLTSSASGGTATGNTDDVFSRIVKIESEQVAGKDVKNPMAARIVGGYAIMFLLFAVAGGAASLFEEKNSGVFARLLASPVRPAHILWSRFLFGVILGLVQITALLLAGRVFFQLEIFSHPLALWSVALAAAAACSAFGILVAAVSPSPAAAQGIATFVVISMSAVGGAWFPVSFMPSYVQAVSKMTLVYWSVEGLTDVLWAGRTFVEVLPKIGILAAIAVGVMGVSIWLFNRNRFFEG